MPGGVGLKDLGGAEAGFVGHGGAGLDPIPEVVVGEPEFICEGDFAEDAEGSEASARVFGVEVEVDAAEGKGADVADSDSEELALGSSVGDFDSVDWRGIEEGFEAVAAFGERKAVTFSDVLGIEVEFLIGGFWGVDGDDEILISAAAASLGVGGGEGLDRDSDLSAGLAVGADGLVEDEAGAAEVSVHEAVVEVWGQGHGGEVAGLHALGGQIGAWVFGLGSEIDVDGWGQELDVPGLRHG